MRIFFRLAAGVVLAVNRHPLAGDHAGREPEPEAEEVADRGMHRQRTMRLVAVQENRDAGDRRGRQANATPT